MTTAKQYRIDDRLGASHINAPHEVRDDVKFAELVADMQSNGWQGRPILVEEGCQGWAALTGSHRIAAAKGAGVAVPVTILDATKLEAWLADDDINIDRWHDSYGLPLAADETMIPCLEEIGDTDALALYAEEIG